MKTTLLKNPIKELTMNEMTKIYGGTYDEYAGSIIGMTTANPNGKGSSGSGS